MVAIGKGEGTLGLNLPEGDGKHPRVNQCYLCKAWQLEVKLQPIEIPDQAGYIQKLACKKCLDKILNAGGTEQK
jgi:hypothetical protein